MEDSVDGPSRGDYSKEPEQQSNTTSRNEVLEGPPLTLASSTTIDPSMRLRAILIAKTPGGRAKGGILGAAVAARVLALREDTVRGWMKREDVIRDEAQALGIDIEVLAASLPKVYPPPVHLVSNSHLSPIVDEQLKRWILLYLDELKEKTIHYSYAINKAREFDPHFMPRPCDNAPQDEKMAFANRARNWFSRFCNRHAIELVKVSNGGSRSKRGIIFTNGYKLRAIDMVRERVEGGRGPDGTRGKKAVARMLGISTHALRNWEGKEEELRRKSGEWKASASALPTGSSSSLTPPSVLISPVPPSMLDLPESPSGLIESPTILSSTEHALPPYFSAWQALSAAHIPPDSEHCQQQKEYNLQHEKPQQLLGLEHQDPNVIIPPKDVQTSVSVDTVSGLKGQQMV